MREAAERLLILGYPDGTFLPGANVTRAEMATIMLRGGGLLTLPTVEISYPDVSPADWFYTVISQASGVGVIRGIDGLAKPNDSITRVEGMVIASRLLRLKGLAEDISDREAEEILSAYSDRDSLPDWAKKDIAICVKHGIINGIQGAIRPSATLTRVEAAIIATRFSKAITDTM